jgi:N-methylhydantoinase A/oxoprolinase/acetone carboxylase beta subunit
MNTIKTVHFIGCGVLGPDVNHVAADLNLVLEKKLLPGGLHDNPALLRRRLQEAIDEAATDKSCVRIIVGYGLCGKGTVGIHAPRGVPLVFPKVHDCIALFLGSDRAYREEFAKYPGTFYISNGWYQEQEKPKERKDERVWVGKEAMGCKEITEKYGKRKGKEIIDFFSTWQNNYQRAAFIDTGIGKADQYEKHARQMALKYNWRYQAIEGSLSLVTRLLIAVESDEQILVVPPGYVTTYSAIENSLGAAAPAEQAGSGNSEPRYLVFGEEKGGDRGITYGLGVDAGGTYTDAAIYNFKEKNVQSKNKALTTKWDFSIGIDKALAGLEKSVLHQVQLVSVSTTLATNAIVEGEGQKAGLLLMPGPGGISDKLIAHRPRVQVVGQMSITGQEKELVDPEEIRAVARKMIERDGVTAFAVSGFGGTVNPAHELEVKKILTEESGMVVCCGHELSDLLNFVVRAQTAVLNARIIPRMVKFFKELDIVLERRNIGAPVMVVKGDGTLISSAMAKERPVETILSGPAASVAGAKLLSGLDNATVIDIGGTTTDSADLKDGLVEVCESGARVGGFATHVKALNMRTVGLGGDSLIQWVKGELLLGPRRVAPIVWADSKSLGGVDRALKFMESRLALNRRAGFSQVVLIAMEGEFGFQPSQEESELYNLLLQRPHCLDELAGPLNLISARFLATERLEESGLVQRCGFTPTDILHINGSFTRWDPKTAHRMAAILAALIGKQPNQLVELLIEKFEKELAGEILKKQLAKDVNVDEKNQTELSRHLIDTILTDKNGNYTINVQLRDPLVGIGAPVHYFLPNAGKKLGGKVVIPENADVANALGAITSHIMIKQQLSIRPDQVGGFTVQGAPGAKRFRRIDTAEEWAVDYLKSRVREMAKSAGTSSRKVGMEIVDHIVDAADGTSLFLERSIYSSLKGEPDLLHESLPVP